MSPIIIFSIGYILGVAALWLILGVTQYDFERIRLQAQQRRHPYARRYRQRPTITALLYVDQDISWCQPALITLQASNYRKLEIILIFPPHLSRSVKHTLVSHRKHQRVSLYENRHDTPAEAILKAYRQFGHGSLVSIFDSTHHPTPNFLSATATYFNQHPDTHALRTHTKIVSSFRMLGLLQRYGEFTRDIYYKALSGLNITPVILKTSGYVYRQSHFMFDDPKILGRSAYSGEISILTHPAKSIFSLLKQNLYERRLFLRALGIHIVHPATLLERITSICLLAGQAAVATVPLLIGYFIFMSVKLHQPLLLSITIATYLSIVIFAIWKSEDLRVGGKLTYIMLAPITLVPTLALSLLAPISLLWELLSLHVPSILYQSHRTS